MRINDTYDLMAYADNLLTEIEGGKLSNTTARVRVQVIKAMIDVKKVEIAAAALGRDFGPVALAKRPRQIQQAA